MAQQTAVKALWEWIDANYHEESFNLNDARDMSLKLEKEQIMKTWYDCKYITIIDKIPMDAEEYYNETYESK